MRAFFVQMMQSLRLRLMAGFALLITICLLLLSLFGSIYYQRTIDEQNIAHSRQMLSQVQNSMDAYVKTSEMLIEYIQNEPDVIQYLRLNDQQQPRRVQLETSVRDRLLSYAASHDEIGGILVGQGDQNTYVTYGFYKITDDELSNETWYRAAMTQPDTCLFTPAPIGRNLLNWRNYAMYDVVMVMKAILDPDTGEPIGAICVDLKLDGIKTLLSELKLGQSGTVFIIDDKGEIVYTPTNPLVYRVRPEWLMETGEDAPVKHRILDEDYFFLSSTSSYTGWQTIALFPYGIPTETSRSVQRLTFLIAALTILFATIVANAITRSVTKPLFSLQRQMKKAELGDLDVHYTGTQIGEVGQLGKSFNAMMDKIRSLLTMVVAEQRSKREAE